jgi:hypothetical protein
MSHQHNEGQSHNMGAANNALKQVAKFKYLETAFFVF